MYPAKILYRVFMCSLSTVMASELVQQTSIDHKLFFYRFLVDRLLCHSLLNLVGGLLYICSLLTLLIHGCPLIACHSSFVDRLS